jgi:hypothetical protein
MSIRIELAHIKPIGNRRCIAAALAPDSDER